MNFGRCDTMHLPLDSTSNEKTSEYLAVTQKMRTFAVA